jgi:2-hydroxychromene-2-carboxylate isomerase
MAVSFQDLLFAFEFVSGGGTGENLGYLCRQSGNIYCRSEYLDDIDELPDDVEDDERYVAIPDKRELDLGKRLVLDFARQFLPDDFDEVRQIFSKRGAYARFKDLLARRDALKQWYDFEQKATERALREWCELNAIELDDQSPPIDLWFSVGSLFTYLTVRRAGDVEKATGVRFRWRPFSVRAIMIEMDNVPLKKPAKLAYSWRDLERRAERYGFPLRARPPYPLKNYDLANLIATVAASEGWCADYVRVAYRRWFEHGQEAGSEPNNSDTLREIGHDPARVLGRAQSEEIAHAFSAATDEARALGIFGAPTFSTRGEIFWGDDRLDDAIAWHRAGSLKPPSP